MLSWGRGEDGQLGHGDAEERPQPQAITHLGGAQCSSVYSGAEYSVAVSSENDQVYSWGWCVPLHHPSPLCIMWAGQMMHACMCTFLQG